ncbi:MAG TPA: hypothetical protein VFE14_03165 [Micromonosporaceae bacterium]|jgi:hypothetical protein|nr:hypothetical protein [Micromonosporaceae bacterium]
MTTYNPITIAMYVQTRQHDLQADAAEHRLAHEAAGAAKTRRERQRLSMHRGQGEPAALCAVEG